MAFLVGLAVVLIILLFATGAAMAFLAWLVLKWVIIIFGILGGIAGGLLFGEKGGVFIGAIFGAAVGVALLAALGNSSNNKS